MDEIQKLQRLSLAGELDVDGKSCPSDQRKLTQGIILTHAQLPNGRVTTLLKSLLTSVCENNCFYCPFRSDRDFKRETIQPDDFANLVVNLTQAGLIQGVFLSSGVAGGGSATQDRLLKTAEILRKIKSYQGYIHLKIMPGADYCQVLQSMRLADRVSINLEAANAHRLLSLAPQKDFNKQLLRPLGWIESIRHNLSPENAWKNRWPSSCTQFVVGGAGESDLELLETTQDLHSHYGLMRAYFSAFRPHKDTPLENHPPATYRRELRLYQADYLLREYGFSYQELYFNTEGNLLEEFDPKTAWAQRNLINAPLEMNTAPKQDLLRVPGIGPKSVEKILKYRRMGVIRDVSSLEKLGINSQKALAFILLNGRQPQRQLSFF
jgi:predicted DNA-binding helix-hairpin-helix protein